MTKLLYHIAGYAISFCSGFIMGKGIINHDTELIIIGIVIFLLRIVQMLTGGKK